MPKGKMLSKKTIHRKLRLQRKRVGGLESVTPDELLASIVGPEPRPRKEIARQLQAILEARGLVDPRNAVVHVPPDLAPIFWGYSTLRQSDLPRVVTYHVRATGRLPGKRRVIVRPPEVPQESEKGKKEKEQKKERTKEKAFVR